MIARAQTLVLGLLTISLDPVAVKWALLRPDCYPGGNNMLLRARGLGNWDNVNNAVNIKRRGAEATLAWCVVTRLRTFPLLRWHLRRRAHKMKRRSLASTDAARSHRLEGEKVLGSLGSPVCLRSWWSLRLMNRLRVNILSCMNHLAIASWKNNYNLLLFVSLYCRPQASPSFHCGASSVHTEWHSELPPSDFLN